MLGSNETHIVDAIVQDHTEIKAYYEQYKKSVSLEDKQKWSNQWRWEVARHSIGEELVAYPALEKYVPGGLAMADKDRAQHHEVKENLSLLEKKTAGHDASAFDNLMDQTQQTLDQHIREEEEHDLVKLRECLPPEEGMRLGSKFKRTKRFVPTHSHPSAPERPPFETVVGLLAAPIDKLRDMFEKFPSADELKEVKPN
ncbi:hypothetical protein GOP47_0020510 [Adiantum capillus-veneris]|uniref:Hemerythrin-like domain-containing protein n=1 Tax=Adiantum capillus-veneris TaxID=13818 RepID=A0A9D4U9U7_ADICA|nr:hypothetical protein GOP47_0020510 [Adiantum capillus-veneris]